MLPTKHSFQMQRYLQIYSKGMEKHLSCKWLSKKAGVEILISDKIDFKTKAVTDKERHYITIKGTIQQENLTIINIYGST